MSVYPAARRELKRRQRYRLFSAIDPREKPNTGANDRLLRFGKCRPIRNSSRTSFLIKSVYLYVRIKQRGAANSFMSQTYLGTFTDRDYIGWKFIRIKKSYWVTDDFQIKLFYFSEAIELTFKKYQKSKLSWPCYTIYLIN